MQPLAKRFCLVALIAVSVLSASPASAQVLDWASGFERPGTDGQVFAMCAFDDGSGSGSHPYVGGFFFHAGAAPARSVACWDGSRWTPLAAGFTGTVRTFAVFDDGHGQALFAGGDFWGVDDPTLMDLARWNGHEWVHAGDGINGEVRALAVFDDGSGPALYVGGQFQIAGVPGTNHIARWNGTNWSPLATGMQYGLYTAVNALAVFDEGAGPRLFAGGDFTNAGGVSVHRIARWDGTAWSALGNGMTGGDANVKSLAACDLGSGMALYASGQFTSAGGVGANRIARWNGNAWSSLGSGLDVGASALCAFDDGGGVPALYAVGAFQSAGGNSAHYVARWNGSWSAVGGGLDLLASQAAVLDDGHGPMLFVGGYFHLAGTVGTDSIARWNGAQWFPVSPGLGMGGGMSEVRVLSVRDSASGDELFAGGGFRSAGTQQADSVARWNGGAWEPLGTGTDGNVVAMASSSHGPGGVPELYVGGMFMHAGGVPSPCLARWDANGWSAVGSGLSSPPGVEVDSLCISAVGPDPGTNLYVGGLFTSAGGVPVSDIARWDGTAWHALGAGLTSSSGSAAPKALAVFDDGSGPALYAGGVFDIAGGAPASHIAKWDGSTWTPLGAGITGWLDAVRSLVGFDDGTGPALYVAGDFTSAGGIPAQSIARWGGGTWSALPSLGLYTANYSLAVHDDGTGNGPALYIGGRFFTNALAPNGVARWRSNHWEGLGTGIQYNYTSQARVGALASCRLHATGPRSLLVGGYFYQAGGKQSNCVAAWGLVRSLGLPFCRGDGQDPTVTVGCPCSNLGAPGHGCASQFNPAGARLEAFGSAEVDPTTGTDRVQLYATGLLWDSTTVFLQGDLTLPGGAHFGDGVRCVGGSIRRLAVKPTINGSARFPEPGDPSLSQAGAVLPGSGLPRFYQAWYRDPSFVFCTNSQFNASSGLQILW
jgi:trimeric autotransporter adhesin